MFSQDKRQKFYIYDPFSLAKIGSKLRVDVHSNGDWHYAVTAFIFFRTVNGDIYVLAQERSQYVDIAQKHFDQSLATQLIVEDEESTDNALARGLKEELSLDKGSVKNIFKWNNIGDIVISKCYAENPDLWNREFVVNYLVEVDEHVSIKENFKVDAYRWLPWREFCDLVRMQPNNFTKSVRIFTVADSIEDEIYKAMSDISSARKPIMLNKKIYYLSQDYDDYVGFESGTHPNIEAYKTTYTMRKYDHTSLTGLESLKKIIFGTTRSSVFDLVV